MFENLRFLYYLGAFIRVGRPYFQSYAYFFPYRIKRMHGHFEASRICANLIGGGLQYDIGLGPWLDVSFEYQTIYNITTEFQVRDAQGTVIGIEKQDITANEFTIKVGVIFFLK